MILRAAASIFCSICQKFVPASAIKWVLASIIVFTVIKYVAAFFGYWRKTKTILIGRYIVNLACRPGHDTRNYP